MRPKHLLVLCLLTAACRKSAAPIPAPAPVASFTTTGDTLTHPGYITLATYDQCLLTSTSANADSVLWNFGNDSTSHRPAVTLWYAKAGAYTLTFTVKNSAGVKSVTTRQVKVVDRVMKQLLITGLVPLLAPVGHSLQHADVWAVIRLAPNGVVYPIPADPNTSFNAPIVYQTPVISGVDSARLPYIFDIPAGMVVNFPALATRTESGLGYTGAGYGLELYARDAGGTWLLSSSYQAGYIPQSGSISWPVADYRRNVFIMKYGNVSVVCDYE
jgi:PKD repeat protein